VLVLHVQTGRQIAASHDLIGNLVVLGNRYRRLVPGDHV